MSEFNIYNALCLRFEKHYNDIFHQSRDHYYDDIVLCQAIRYSGESVFQLSKINLLQLRSSVDFVYNVWLLVSKSNYSHDITVWLLLIL